MHWFKLRGNPRHDDVLIIVDEEEERQQRLKDFKKVIQIYCENLKSRTSQSTGHKQKGGK